VEAVVSLPASRKTAGHPPNLTGNTLGQHGHICAFFNSIDEQHRVLRLFIKDGFDQGDKAYHYVDPELRDEHLPDQLLLEIRERQLARRLSGIEIIPDVDGGPGPCRGIVIPVGVNAEGGVVSAACGRIGFPTEIDQLLLGLAANHAATAFQNTTLIHERSSGSFLPEGR